MSISSSGSLSVTNDNSNIYSILSSENNVITKDATLGEWLRLPTKARSLFGMEFSGDPYSLDSYKLLMPMSIQKLTGDAQQIRLWLAMVKSFRNINTLYSKSTFTNDDLEMFFKVIINIIHFSEGDTFDGSVWRPVKSCAYIGSDFSSAVNSFGTKMFCKQSYLDLRTSKYIDVISNTVFLFLKKVASNNPELLKNSSFKAIIDFFNDMVQSIYYFVGKKYSWRRLCNRLSFFVKNVNFYNAYINCKWE